MQALLIQAIDTRHCLYNAYYVGIAYTLSNAIMQALLIQAINTRHCLYDKQCYYVGIAHTTVR